MYTINLSARTTMKKEFKKTDIAQVITDTFAAQIQGWIDDGVEAPRWSMPWVNKGNGECWPIRADGTPYRGTNVFWLWMVASQQGYSSNQWFGFGAAKEASAKAAREQGRNIETRDRKRGKGQYYWDVDNDCLFEGGVRKGEKATPVVFYKKIEVEDKKAVTENGDPAKKFIPLLKYYNVFNRDQIEGLPAIETDATVVEFDSVAAAEAVIEGFDLPLNEGGNRAYYSPSLDEYHVPGRDQFNSPGEFYAAVFHEQGHATGHKSRLDRLKKAEFGSKEYAFEELVAELTAAFVCAETGVEGRIQHVEYLAHWLKVLGEDKNAIIRASSKAQAAADYIMGREPVQYAKAA